VRVKMKNFLTYEEAEVFPGPRLNVVLGPNGTGKSAMTHAICLACGGNPSSVGRSTDLTQFVRRGSQGGEAYAEVDILKTNRVVVSVRRVINTETKGSKWFMDERSSTQRDVKAAMKAMNIDVDNLCSFMAQDKVGSFSQANAKEILHMTLESIVNSTGKKLSEEQKELASVESTKLARQREMDARQSQVESLQNDLDGMRAEVERMEQRGAKKKLLEQYKMKEIVTLARVRKDAVTEAQNKVDAAQAILDAGKEELNPLESSRRDLERKLAERVKSNKNVQAKVRNAEDAVNEVKETIDDLGSELGSVLHQKKNHDKEKRRAEEEHNAAKANFERTKHELSMLEATLPDLKRKMAHEQEDMAEQKRKRDEKEEDAEVLKEQLRVPQGKLKEATREINAFKDPRQQYIRQLREQNRHGHIIEAMDWVEKNKADLRGPVYGPIGMYLQVENKDVAQCVEKHIGFSMAMQFIVTSEDDEKFMKDALWKGKDKGQQRVNIRVMTNRPQTKRPYKPELMAQFASDFGSIGYLLDYLIMPEDVKAHLVTWKSVDTVLVARAKDAQDKVSNGHVRQALAAYSQGCSIYTISPGISPREKSIITSFNGSMSQYKKNTEPIITRAPVPHRQNLMCSVADSTDGSDEKRRWEEQRDEANDVIRVLNDKISKAESTLEKYSKDVRNRNAAVQEMLKQINKPKTMQDALRRSKKKVVDLLEKIRGLESNAHLDEISNKLTNAVNAQVGAFNKLNGKIEDYFKEYQMKEVMNICSGDLENALETIKLKLLEKKREVEELKVAVDDARCSRDEANAAFKEADEKLNDLERQYGEKLFMEMFGEIIENCPEEALVDLETRIETLQREIDDSIENADIVNRYENTKEELEEAKAEFESATRDFDAANSTMESRSSEWKKSVRALAEKMDILFASFMEELTFRGGLSFKEVGTIERYEMCLKVAFRGNEALSELSGQQHSGGERAVSTIMYLMALQEMTSSPFRVVDEINQVALHPSPDPYFLL
jgi:chromosome segregation ATPase